MKTGIKTAVEATISALIGLAVASLVDWPWYFFLATAVGLFVTYNCLLVPIWTRFFRKGNPLTNEIEPPDASGFEVGVAKIFPKGVGIGIIGGSDNHVTNSVVRGWSNGVGIGVFDSPGSTVENSDVSDGTTEK